MATDDSPPGDLFDKNIFAPSDTPSSTAPPQRPPPPSNASTSMPPSKSGNGAAFPPQAPLPNTVAALRCDQVRWMYQRSKGKNASWRPFCGRDSLLIEVAYRLHRGLIIDTHCPQDIIVTCRDHAVSVLDDLYKLNLLNMSLESIYWQDIDYTIRRGTWFYPSSWQPLDEDLADKVEEEHMRVFDGQRIPMRPVLMSGKKPVVATITHQDLQVKWNSIIDVNVASSGLRGKFLNFISRNTTSISRGFDKLANEFDGCKPVGHLIFVIPGIGQKRFKTAIVDNTGELREMVNQYYEVLYSATSDTCPLMLPVEWRSTVTLDGGNIELITPRYMETVRDILNTTAMDLMYYMSPLYGQEIFDAVVFRMNELFAKFLAHNPSFVERGGKVSVIGHSLGSVIAYDIVNRTGPPLGDERKSSSATMRPKFSTLDGTMAPLHSAEDDPPIKSPTFSSTPSYEDNSRLFFSVDKLICLGSPLGVFLQLRQINGLHIKPAHITRMYNMFHPLDVVAYRLEPMICPHYALMKPVKVLWADDVIKHMTNPEYDDITPELHSYKSRQRHDKFLASKEGNEQLVESASSAALIRSARSDIDSRSIRSGQLGDQSSDEEDTPPDTSPVPPPRRHHAMQTKEVGEQFSRSLIGQELDEYNAREMTDVELAVDVTFTLSDNMIDEDTSSLASSSTQPSPTPKRKSDDLKNAIDRWPANYEDLASALQPHEKLDHRMDFMLRQARAEISNVKALTAHTCYWTNHETALFIVYAIYGPVSGVTMAPAGGGGETRK